MLLPGHDFIATAPTRLNQPLQSNGIVMRRLSITRGLTVELSVARMRPLLSRHAKYAAAVMSYSETERRPPTGTPGLATTFPCEHQVCRVPLVRPQPPKAMI